MFVCVCLWQGATQRVHTSLDTITITHLCDCRLHKSSNREFHHNTLLLRSILCCLCPCCTHNSSWSLAFHACFRSNCCSTLIHGRTSCRPLISCLRSWSISRTKRCRRDREEAQQNERQRRCVHILSKSHPHAHSWQTEGVHKSSCGMDNVAIHVQSVRVCNASEDERSLQPCHTERTRYSSTTLCPQSCSH